MMAKYGFAHKITFFIILVFWLTFSDVRNHVKIDLWHTKMKLIGKMTETRVIFVEKIFRLETVAKKGKPVTTEIDQRSQKIIVFHRTTFFEKILN